jgi:hypothetical protein
MVHVVSTTAAEEQSVRSFGVEKKKLLSPFFEVNLCTVCAEFEESGFWKPKERKVYGKCIKVYESI